MNAPILDLAPAVIRYATRHVLPVSQIHTTTAMVIWLVNHRAELPHDLPPYMPKLISDAMTRIWRLRYNRNMLSFSDNEVIMLDRLYYRLTGRAWVRGEAV